MIIEDIILQYVGFMEKLVIAYIILINAIGLLMMKYDKYASQKNREVE